MPYKNPEKRRAYQQRLRAKKRLATLELREKVHQHELEAAKFQYAIEPRSLGEVTKDELRQVLEFTAYKSLAGISDDDIAKSPLLAKVKAATAASEHALLLAGQPTEIVSVKELGKLDELSGLLLAELKRRSAPALPEPVVVEAEVMAP